MFLFKTKNPHTHLHWRLSTTCTGFGWDRIYFFPTSWYSAMFSICDQNSVDNTSVPHTIWHHAQQEKLEGVEFARAAIAWGLAGHQSASSEQLKDGVFLLWHGVFKFFLIITLFSWFCFCFLYLLSCLYINPQVFPLFGFSPSVHCWGMSKQLCGA